MKRTLYAICRGPKVEKIEDITQQVNKVKRFAAHPSSREALSYLVELEKPKSLDAILFRDFADLKREREKVDKIVIRWVKQLSAVDLTGCLSYTNMAGNSFSKQFLSLINQAKPHD